MQKNHLRLSPNSNGALNSLFVLILPEVDIISGYHTQTQLFRFSSDNEITSGYLFYRQFAKKSYFPVI
jgi:hypothetical protein